MWQFAIANTVHPWGHCKLCSESLQAGQMALCGFVSWRELRAGWSYSGYIEWKTGVTPPSLEMPGGSRMSWGWGGCWGVVGGWGAWRCMVLMTVFIHCSLWPA